MSATPFATLPDMHFAHLEKGVFTWRPAKLLSEHLAIGLPAEILVLETTLASFPDRPTWEKRGLIVQPTEPEKGREFSFKCHGVVASEAPPGVVLQVEPTYMILANWKRAVMKDHFKRTLYLLESIRDRSPDARLTDSP